MNIERTNDQITHWAIGCQHTDADTYVLLATFTHFTVLPFFTYIVPRALSTLRYTLTVHVRCTRFIAFIFTLTSLLASRTFSSFILFFLLFPISFRFVFHLSGSEVYVLLFVLATLKAFTTRETKRTIERLVSPVLLF